MNEYFPDDVYKKAKKIRTNLLLFTDNYMKKKLKQKNTSDILSLKNKNLYRKDSMKVSFQEFYVESNIQIITHEVEKQEKKIIPNLSSMSFHMSEKSLCTYKDSPLLSTAETIQTKETIKNDKNEFFNKKSKTKNIYLMENRVNKLIFDYEKLNKISNKSLQTYYAFSNNYFNKTNILGKKYLRDLSKYLGIIPHKKKKDILISHAKYNITKKNHKRNSILK